MDSVAIGDYSQERVAFLKEHSLFRPTTAEQINIFFSSLFLLGWKCQGCPGSVPEGIGTRFTQHVRQ